MLCPSRDASLLPFSLPPLQYHPSSQRRLGLFSSHKRVIPADTVDESHIVLLPHMHTHHAHIYTLSRAAAGAPRSHEYHPLVTVIIPAYNEEVGVVATLQSVAQSYYRNVHIIVVNDGSKDATEECILEFLALYNASADNGTGKKPHIPIHYVPKPNGGKATAIQRGLEELPPECELVMTMSVLAWCWRRSSRLHPCQFPSNC